MTENLKKWDDILNGLEKECCRFEELKKNYDENVDVINQTNSELEKWDKLVRELEKKETFNNQKLEEDIKSIQEEYYSKIQENETLYNNNVKSIESYYISKKNEEIYRLQENRENEEQRIVSKMKDKEKELQRVKNTLKENEVELKKVENELSDIGQEHKQIIEVKKKIQCDYNNIKNNEKLIQDYRNEYEFDDDTLYKKYNQLSDNELITIAKELNKGRYISKPTEGRGLPLGDIFNNAFCFVMLVLSMICNGIKLIYNPVKKIRSLKLKCFYMVGTVIVIFLLLKNTGDIIVTLIMSAIFIFLAFVVSVLIFNVFKYSDKNRCIEENLRYYAVGYYFIEKYEEIMHRIAKIRFEEMKSNSLNDPPVFILDIQETLKNKRQAILKSIENDNINLKNIKADFEKINLELNKIKLLINDNFKNEMKNIEVVFLEEKNKKMELEEKIYKQKNVEINNELNNRKNSVLGEIQMEKLFKQKKIDEYEKNKLLWDQEIKKRQDQIGYIIKEAKKIEVNSMKWRDEADRSKINLIKTREGNDKLGCELFVGFARMPEEKSIIYDNVKISPYILKIIKNDFNPIVIVFSGVDEEERKITEAYYSLVDFALTNLIATKYFGALKFEIIDSKGSVQRIKSSMQYSGENNAYENLKKLNILEIHCREKADKVVKKIIQSREKELDGKTIEEKNSENVKSDKMIQYIIMPMKIYNDKERDFTMKNINQNFADCKCNGIIPILLISDNSFEKEKETIKLAIREQCDGKYYKWDFDSQRNNNLSEIDLEIIKVC